MSHGKDDTDSQGGSQDGEAAGQRSRQPEATPAELLEQGRHERDERNDRYDRAESAEWP